MIRKRDRLAWILVACAAAVAQASPQSCCGACSQPCCAERADHRSPAASPREETGGGCPLCAAADTAPEPGSDSRPCRCRLEARQGQPVVPSQGSLRVLADGGGGTGPADLMLDMPPVHGVSREYVAASLAVPIRPPRILFGVWRN